MVTHDIGLKNFAHRVVRMLDGKIHKIEENAPENRKQHMMALNQIVEQYSELARGDGENQDNLGVREGITKKKRRILNE